MCQYDITCDTYEHRPGTVCRKQRSTPRRPATWTPPRAPATATRRVEAAAQRSAPSRQKRHDSRVAAGSGGVDGAALLLSIILAGAAEDASSYPPAGTFAFVFGVFVAAIAPFAVGLHLSSRCRGWRVSPPDTRCLRRRIGLGKHCAEHGGWNLYDSLALVSHAIGAVGIVILLPRLLAALGS